jgi:hypothetical protein
MDPISFHQLFLKALPELAKYAGEQALKQVRTSVAIAIAETASHFSRHPGALAHLAGIARDPNQKDHVHVLAWRHRTLARERSTGRLNDSPDSRQQTDAAHAATTDAPALILLRNNGAEKDGWRDLAFWWPVVVVPQGAVTSIFAGNTPAIPEISPYGDRPSRKVASISKPKNTKARSSPGRTPKGHDHVT